MLEIFLRNLPEMILNRSTVENQISLYIVGIYLIGYFLNLFIVYRTYQNNRHFIKLSGRESDTILKELILIICCHLIFAYVLPLFMVICSCLFLFINYLEYLKRRKILEDKIIEGFEMELKRLREEGMDNCDNNCPNCKCGKQDDNNS